MIRFLLLFVLFLGSATTGAREAPLWEAGAGVFGMRLPDYRGANEYRNYLLPFPYLVYRGDLLKVDRRGATGVLYRDPKSELDLTLNAANPVNSSKNEARAGMPNLDPTIELGPRFKYNLAASRADAYELSLQLPVRGVITLSGHPHTIGILANPLVNLDLGRALPGGWSLGLQAGPLFADRSYHKYYYEVDPRYATATRPEYRARAGYSGTQFTIATSKRYRRVWVGAFVRAYDLHGAAFEDSPLVRSKSAVQAGIGVAYVFAESSTMVEADD